MAFKKKDKKVHTQDVRVSKSTYGKLVFKRVLRSLGVGVLFLGILYLCLSATLLRVVPTFDGLVPVKNMTYRGGIAPEGAVLLVSQEKNQKDNPLDRLRQAFVPDSSAVVVKVVAGPYGKLNWAPPNILTVEGVPSKVPFPKTSDGKSPIADKDEPYLKDEYYVECIKGACEPGTGLIIQKDKIYGTVITKTSAEKAVTVQSGQSGNSSEESGQ